MNIENDSKWLFKYMPFNLYAAKLLKDNKLWFGKPDTQNDPNETEFILKDNEKVNCFFEFRIAIQGELNNWIQKSDPINQILTEFEKSEFETHLKELIRDDLGICSMSVICDDILMWARYANNNRGICIVFDKNVLLNSFTMHSGKVSYSSNFTNATFTKSGKFGQLLSDKVFFMEKLDNWMHECEYSFVTRYNDRIIQKRVDRLEPFPENAIVGIILGENFPKEEFKTLINLVYSENSEKEFYFWKSARNLYNHSIDIIPISDEHESLI